MKAVVFAAGIGSRLKPFTDSHPKALAPIGASTALDVVIDKLVAAGADGIIVNVHHFAGQIKEHIASRRYPVDIEISDESALLLDTGGALAKIARESRLAASMAPDEPLIVHNADILTDFPLGEMTAALAAADVCVLVDPARSTSRYLLFDSRWRMKGWTDLRTGTVRPADVEAATCTRAAFGGVHAMKRNVLDRISTFCGPELHPFSIIDYYIGNCRTTAIEGYVPPQPYHWFDIGTPQRLQAAQAFAL